MDATTPLDRLGGHIRAGTCELKAMLSLAKEEVDSHPFTYARLGGTLSGVRLPADTHGIIFTDTGEAEEKEVLLTSTPLSLSACEAFDLYPVNKQSRLSLAEELAPLITSLDSVVLSKPGTDRGVAVHRTGRTSRYQYTLFDRRGFISDHEVISLAAGLEEATHDGYTIYSPTLLDKLAITEEFIAGNEITMATRRLLSDDALHTLSVGALRRIAHHEFEVVLDRITAIGETALPRLEEMLARWTEESGQVSDGGAFPDEAANLSSLRARINSLKPDLSQRARSRSQLIEDFAAEIIRMKETAELVRTAPEDDAKISIRDLAGELLATLVEDDNPPPHRVDEFNHSWTGEGGTEGFLNEIANMAYGAASGIQATAPPHRTQ